MPIDAIGAIRSGEGAALLIPGTAPTNNAGSSFGKMLTDAIAEVNQAQQHAGSLTAQFAAGRSVDVHQVMIAAQEASTMLNMAVQVRNKVVDAYQEVMRINL